MDQVQRISGSADQEKAAPSAAGNGSNGGGSQLVPGPANNANGASSGNNSDNSGIVSLGNNSFGFNFEEEGMTSLHIPNADGSGKGSDSDGSLTAGGPAAVSQPQQSRPQQQAQGQAQLEQPQPQPQDRVSVAASQPAMIEAAPPAQNTSESHTHAQAAAVAVANLKSIAASTASAGAHMLQPQTPISNVVGPQHTVSNSGMTEGTSGSVSHPALVSLSSSGSGPDPGPASSAVLRTTSDGSGAERPKKKPKKLDENKREERNAREKERSFRISRQINELRNLLSSGGVIVPKGTKSSVLTEAANYIRMLQQHQYRSEIDRHQLVQQMQMIGGGALGQQAASAVRHVAAQNGVWSLGNFGGVPPKSAMSYYQGGKPTASQTTEAKQPPDPNAPLPTKIEDPEYRFIFNSCSVGMAIASMGGAFIDCNQLFCQLSNYTKQEVCSMTIFNLTSRQDLQHAFDLISQMISPPVDGRQAAPKLCVLRGAMKNRNDLGLSVALIKGDDGIAKCFCVTLIKNPASPFDPSKPIPASADMIQSQPVVEQHPVTIQQAAAPAAIPNLPPPAIQQHVRVIQQPQPVTMQQQQQQPPQPASVQQSPKDGSSSLNSSPAYTTG